jgi:ABC-2 type transport system permease protein
MRWRILINALRTGGGKFELGSRLVAGFFFVSVGAVAGVGCGVLAHSIVANRQLVFLPALLWPIFLMWQMVPVLLSAASESVELNFLLRFPVSFRSYTLLYLFFGLFDPSSVLGALCLLGAWTGVVSADPRLIAWITAALAIFALFNQLMTRMIFAWIERWLAQRRTREVLGIVALLVFLSLQLLNPAVRGHSGHPPPISRAALAHALSVIRVVQSVFPPGLAGGAVESAAKGRPLLSFLQLGGTALYALAAGSLLALRLRGEFRGENFGEAPASSRTKSIDRRQVASQESAGKSDEDRGWLDGPVGAMLAKEVHILLRSGVMLVGLFTPLIFIFVLGGPMSADRSFHFPYMFPVAIAYGFLPLTRQFCNSLGTEGTGIQLYFLSPTPFRSVMMAKNLLQTGLFCVELALVATLAVFRLGMPSPLLAFTTLCWVLFALPANLAVGNILSVTLAYRMSLSRLSREQGSVGNGLLSLLAQLLIFAVGAAVYLPLALSGHPAFAPPVLLLLAAGSVMLWLRGLANIDGMANRRSEALIRALVRPA